MKFIGELHQSDEFSWESGGVNIPALFNTKWHFVFEDFDPMSEMEEYQEAINNLMVMNLDDFKICGVYLFQYYKSSIKHWGAKSEDYINIPSSDDIWEHIDISSGYYITISKDFDGDVYLSLSANCDWEQEHGLQIVYHKGNELVKVGSFTGHLRNSDPKTIFQG